MLDVNGTLRVRSLDNGSAATNFNQVLVTSPDGTIGKTSRSSFAVVEKYQVYGTAPRLNITNTQYTVQPGMTQTFALSAPASVIIWATIGATLPAGNTATVNVDAALFIDGQPKQQGGFNRFTLVGSSSAKTFNTVAINTMINLTAGSHTIELRTASVNVVPNLTIGGNASVDVNPGEMTIQVLY
ncbi:hypothetical protein GCM10028773_46130 [Spirosoma koreense]